MFEQLLEWYWHTADWQQRHRKPDFLRKRAKIIFETEMNLKAKTHMHPSQKFSRTSRGNLISGFWWLLYRDVEAIKEIWIFPYLLCNSFSSGSSSKYSTGKVVVITITEARKRTQIKAFWGLVWFIFCGFVWFLFFWFGEVFLFVCVGFFYCVWFFVSNSFSLRLTTKYGQDFSCGSGKFKIIKSLVQKWFISQLWIKHLQFAYHAWEWC